jgi:hypothetical protein
MQVKAEPRTAVGRSWPTLSEDRRLQHRDAPKPTNLLKWDIVEVDFVIPKIIDHNVLVGRL